MHNMHAKYLCMCVIITSCCSVYNTESHKHTHTHTHTGMLCSSCATPPRWRPADGTGPVSVCGTEVWWGRLLTKLPGTYPGPIFLPFSLRNAKTTPSSLASHPFSFRWNRTDHFQLYCARRQPAGTLPLRHPHIQHLSSNMIYTCINKSIKGIFCVQYKLRSINSICGIILITATIIFTCLFLFLKQKRDIMGVKGAVKVTIATGCKQFVNMILARKRCLYPILQLLLTITTQCHKP